MAEIKKLVYIEYSAEQMFELVDYCEAYREFLPWCGGAEVLERSPTRTVATLHVHYRGIKTHFTTENSKIFPYEMHIRLKEGPFRYLEANWRFTPLGESGCKIEFEQRYQFSNRLLDKVLSPVFNFIASTFVESFVKRAQEQFADSA